MKELVKWMVGLDLTDHDNSLIEYTRNLSRQFSPEEIVFVHIKRRENIPTRFRVKLEYSRNELLEMVKSRVYEVFPEREEIKCEVHEGTPYFDLWRETHLHGSDLFIVGEKHLDKGRNIVPEKFAQKSFCSILLVPSESKEPKHIWVPIDFSENSVSAVHAALQFKDASRITCHHIFESPSIDLIDQDKRLEYIAYYQEESEEEMTEYLGTIEGTSKIRGHFTHRLYAKLADHVKEEAEEHSADLIVMSSGGKSRVSKLFLGSTTSELIRLEKAIPLLIIKEKIDRVRAWDIISNL